MKIILSFLVAAMLCGSGSVFAKTSHFTGQSVVGEWRGYAIADAFSTPDASCHYNYHVTFMKGDKAHVVRTVNNHPHASYCTDQDFVTGYTKHFRSVTLNLQSSSCKSAKCQIQLREKHSLTQGRELKADGYVDIHPKGKSPKRIHYVIKLFTALSHS